MSTQSLSDVVVNLIDDDRPDLGLKLLFKGATKCNDTANYQLEV